MKRLFLNAIAVVFVVVVCVSPADAKKKEVVRVPGGTNIPQAGIVIDASYDPRLDTLVPGYKVINVVMINQSFNFIRLHPEKDKWSIKLAGKRNPIDAIYNLRRADPKAWSAVPEGARDLLDYPLVLPVGARLVIDIFVPDTVDMQDFNELRAYIRSLNTQFEVLVSQ